MRINPRLATIFLFFAVITLSGCAPKVKLFGEPSPLQQYTLQGDGDDKILLINIHGVIDNKPSRGWLSSRPGMVQQVVTRLDAAREDDAIRSVLLVIDSPGGGVTASDVIQHELARYKKDTGNKVVALFMDIAASGGYYIATAADGIVAHPSTVTGSIGTVFIRPQVSGLMDKIGVEAIVTKSGAHKDMGSPFREETEEEQALFQTMIDTMNNRFQTLVQESRKLSQTQASLFADARILTANQALEAGLVDRIGYMEDALRMVEEKAGIENPRVVAYRESSFPNESVYNNMETRTADSAALINISLAEFLAVPRTGFYYLWAPEYVR
ncbi:signal peptide peptidase SppA [Desulfovibrio mangrovi]|uniref:signal peptide peptidase SppA n=1 Tax=Desulfovibrio mangrovi TaxID=2976983 RepID=UPI002247CAC8|nr:signal peptide peptidase SppA [Desulfovibrio mangrovi]UZP67360.1 signal peptide peptidase SppA [Desulfovibrio mangrovi]